MTDYVPGQNDPYQEPVPTEMTLYDALHLIAERTAFRTEVEAHAVYAAIRNAAAQDTDSDDEQEDGAEDGDGQGDKPSSIVDADPPAKKTTPAKKTASVR
jgi:hypothetical protein